jgi:hypothetical protein
MVHFLSFNNKSYVMKGSRNENNKQSKQSHVNMPKPEIRDNMDSRKEKEAGFAGNDNKPAKKDKKNK